MARRRAKPKAAEAPTPALVAGDRLRLNGGIVGIVEAVTGPFDDQTGTYLVAQVSYPDASRRWIRLRRGSAGRLTSEADVVEILHAFHLETGGQYSLVPEI